LDYALSYEEQSGYTHMVSVSWQFGLSASAAEKTGRERVIQQTLQELSQKMFAAYRQQGVNFSNVDQVANAVEAFKKALVWKKSAELENTLIKLEDTANRRTARQYFEQANFKWAGQRELEAVEDLQEALRLNPADEEFTARLDHMHQELTGRARKASAGGTGKNAFLRALDAFFQGDYAAALAGWKALAQSNPDYPEVGKYQGDMQQILLRQQMLRPLRSKELDLKVRALSEQAAGYFAADQFNRAQKTWQEILRMDPTNDDAKMNLERVNLIIKTLRDRGVD
jgi:tetratricopeptide (TPR) repeat protein